MCFGSVFHWDPAQKVKGLSPLEDVHRKNAKKKMMQVIVAHSRVPEPGVDNMISNANDSGNLLTAVPLWEVAGTSKVWKVHKFLFMAR